MKINKKIITLLSLPLVPLNILMEFAEDIITKLVSILLGFAATVSGLVDSFAMRNPYPCSSSGGATGVELVCGSGGQPGAPIFAPFPISPLPSASSVSGLPGIWTEIAKIHLFIIAISFTLLIIGAAITRGMLLTDLFNVDNSAKKASSTSGLIKNAALIFFWWPLAAFGMWIVEIFAILVSTLMATSVNVSAMKMFFEQPNKAPSLSGKGKSSSLPKKYQFGGGTGSPTGGGITNAIVSIKNILNNPNSDVKGLGGLTIFGLVMFVLAIPYLLIGVILVVLWSMRVVAIIVIFPLVPIKYGFSTLKFSAIKAVTDPLESITDLFIFLVTLPIITAFAAGILGIMGVALAVLLGGGGGGIGNDVSFLIYLLFLVFSVVLYGFAPILLARYTSYDPQSTYGGVVPSGDSLSKMDLREISKGDYDNSAKDRIKKGDIGGAVSALSGSAQQKIDESDAMMDIDEDEGVVGSTASKPLKKISKDTGIGETMDAVSNSIRHNSTKAFNRSVEKKNRMLGDEETADMIEERIDRLDEDYRRENLERNYKNRREEDYEDSVISDMGEDEEFIREKKQDRMNTDLGRRMDISEFEDVSSEAERNEKVTESLAEAVGEDDNEINHNQVIENVEDEDELGSELMQRAEEVMPDEELQNVKDMDDALDTENGSDEEQFIEKLEKAGYLETFLNQVADDSSVNIDYSDDVMSDARENELFAEHAEEKDLDMKEMDTEGKSVTPEMEEIKNASGKGQEYARKGSSAMIESKEESAKDTIQEFDQIREETQSEILNEINKELREMTEEKAAEKVDDFVDKEEMWEKFFGDSANDVEGLLDEIFDEQNIDGVEGEMLEDMKRTFLSKWDDTNIKTKNQFNTLMKKAQEEVKEDKETIDVGDLSEYGEYLEENDLFSEISGLDDIESAQEFEKKYNEDKIEEYSKIFGFDKEDNLNEVVRKINKGNYNKKEAKRVMFEQGSNSIAQIAKLGKAIDEGKISKDDLPKNIE